MCVARILRALNGRLGSPLDEHDLADLVQDTVIVILRKLGQYVDGWDLEGWVFQICRFELMNAVRRKRRHPVSNLEVNQVAERKPGADPVSSDADVVAGLALLETDEAAVLRLKYFEDLSFPEVAVRLGIPLGTVKTRHYRGISKLSQFIAGREDAAVS